MDPTKKTLIIVSGNIAAGKSTLINKIRDSPLCQKNSDIIEIIKEDIRRWNNVPGPEDKSIPLLDIYLNSLSGPPSGIIATF